MSFYGDLSKYYKYIFPATEPQLTFFKTLYRENGVKKVLDVACGTGEYTREFAAWGIESYGIDIQREMIQLAQERARKEGLPAFFNTADMLKLPFGNEEFHGTICIGNSLVHLLKEEEILQALQEMRRVTVGDGLIIIQIVNYDKVFQENICQLPLITVEAVGMQFARHYKFRDDGKIDFSTILTVKKDGEKSEYRNTVVLKPLVREDMDRLLAEAGFDNSRFYGNFKGEPWSEKTFATIVKTIK